MHCPKKTVEISEAAPNSQMPDRMAENQNFSTKHKSQCSLLESTNGSGQLTAVSTLTSAVMCRFKLIMRASMMLLLAETRELDGTRFGTLASTF